MVRMLVARKGWLTESTGSIMLEVLLSGVLLSLLAASLFTALLGADRSTRKAGQYTEATALGQSVIEEMRLMPLGDPRLEPGSWDWCPPECPTRIDRAQVEVELPTLPPQTLRRVTVSIFRTGVDEPVQVVSYVRK